MTPTQAVRLERIEHELKLSEGQLLAMAREISPSDIPLRSIGDLTDHETEQLILMASTARELVAA